MASQHSMSLEQYCSHFNCSFFNLHLPCIFCGHLLTPEDLAAFSFKNLSLLLRNSQYFACCIKCCCLSARFEFERYYQCCVPAINIEIVSGKHLHALTVRCYNCMKQLDIAEKYDIFCRDDFFHLCRSQWRGLCRSCVQK